MWYKIRELYSKGFNKTQIAFQLGLHRSTVRRYLKMDEDTLTENCSIAGDIPAYLTNTKVMSVTFFPGTGSCPPPRFMTG